MTEYLDKVSDFIRAMDASRDLRFWTKLIKEETAEVIESVVTGDRVNGLKERADLVYVLAGAALATPVHANLYTEAEWDEYIQACKVAESAAIISEERFHFGGFVVREAFLRVHESNMSKLDDNGQPIRREDGKILKGPNYREPDLTDLV